MHLQVLSSGSQGNATLVRAGEESVLVDAGLAARDMEERFVQAGFAPARLAHILVTHGHLDHARSAGLLSRRHRATLHCAQAILQNRAIRRSKRLATLRVGTRQPLAPLPVVGAGTSASTGAASVEGGLQVTPVLLPHDARPTLAFRLEHRGRAAVILTDMGRPSPSVARALGGPHVLVLEFNYDPRMLAEGPYSDALKRRISGNAGHLSNEQAGEMLRLLAGEELHTLVLAHLSAHNNTPEKALACAHSVLAGLGRSDVKILVASQDEVGPNLEV